MTTPPAPGSNGRSITDTRASGANADALVERELLVLAQARQLRERPAELLAR